LSSWILEKFLLHAGTWAYPVFDTKFAKVGVYICYDRHFPKEPAPGTDMERRYCFQSLRDRWLASSEYLWELEQPAHAVRQRYFVGAINRRGEEKHGSIGGSSMARVYFCQSAGQDLRAGQPRQRLMCWCGP